LHNRRFLGIVTYKGDSVIVFSFTGERLRAWQCCAGATAHWIQVTSAGTVLVSNDGSDAAVSGFDSFGNRTQSVTIPSCGPSRSFYGDPVSYVPSSVTVDETTNRLYVAVFASYLFSGFNKQQEGTWIFVFDSQGTFLARHSFTDRSMMSSNLKCPIFVCPDGSVDIVTTQATQTGPTIPGPSTIVKLTPGF